ncbi:VWFA domain-containing protein, partial [Balamuthia mandrillaris]
MENDTSFPESYICPLTQEVMRDPVVDPEGNSYERTAIEAWLRKNSTSPITRAPLSSKDLVPNRALRDAIQQRCAELNVTLEPLPESKASSASSASASSSSSSAAASSSTTTTATGPVTMTISSRKDPSQQDITEVLISIQPQDSSTSSSSSSSTSRAPIDICCVVDVSGSMGTEATMKKADGGVERHGLSLLDVVKHAVKTIVSALQPNDRLGLVVYSTEARTISGLTAMTEGAKQQVINKLEALTPEDTTNLWDGLQMGMDMLRKHATPPQQEARSHRRLQAVLLLTDGLPNISPPRGELAMMKRYMDQHGADLLRNSCSLHTFGFGYGINSQLLRDLAIEGDGSYSFIPDSSFVGTVFVHAVSNLLATMATGARLALEPLGGQVGFVDGEQGIMGGHLCRAASWGVTVNLCSLQYGQSKDLVLRMKDVPAGGEEAFLSATLKYVPVADGAEDGDAVEVRAEATPSSVAPEVELIVQRARLRLVEALSQAMLDMKAGAEDSARARVKGLADSLELDNFQRSEPRLKALLEDVSGQVTEAFSRKDWYDRWGVHYLYSLIRAHQLQTCNNFKDPGVQFYGGGLFGALRDQIDDLFCKLPPPKPSRAAA